mgnify:CR=1 FL=1
MKFILKIACTFILCTYAAPQEVQAPAVEMKATPIVWNKAAVQALIKTYSAKYEVPYSVMDKVVECETAGTYQVDIQSGHYRNGVREQSFGLSQINLPSWKGITKEQATNPHFALNFLGEKLKKGDGHLWTCYRMHFAVGNVDNLF